MERLAATLPLTAFLFDLLHLDGQDLLDRPGAERHAALAATVPEPLRIPRTVTADRNGNYRLAPLPPSRNGSASCSPRAPPTSSLSMPRRSHPGGG